MTDLPATIIRDTTGLYEVRQLDATPGTLHEIDYITADDRYTPVNDWAPGPRAHPPEGLPRRRITAAPQDRGLDR